MAKLKVNFRNNKKRKQSQNEEQEQPQQQEDGQDVQLIPHPTKKQKKLLAVNKHRHLSKDSQKALNQKVLEERFQDDEETIDIEEDARESSYDGDDDDDQEKELTEIQSGEQKSRFSQAFESILKAPRKPKRKTDKKEQKNKGGGIVLEDSTEFQESKEKARQESLAKQQRRKLKLEMKTRGHVSVPKKGEDVARDVFEKQLQRVATRGVVQLFNAVAKAQKVQRDAHAIKGRAQAAKMTKASITAELQKAKQASQVKEDVGKKGQRSGWRVLQDDFTGLPVTGRMKDWEREQENLDDVQDLDDNAMQLDEISDDE